MSNRPPLSWRRKQASTAFPYVKSSADFLRWSIGGLGGGIMSHNCVETQTMRIVS